MFYIISKLPRISLGHLSFRSSSVMAESCKQYLNDPLPPGSDPGQIISGFRQAVNMTPQVGRMKCGPVSRRHEVVGITLTGYTVHLQEIEAFLCRDESRQAAEDGDDKEKEGRHMARRYRSCPSSCAVACKVRKGPQGAGWLGVL